MNSPASSTAAAARFVWRVAASRLQTKFASPATFDQWFGAVAPLDLSAEGVLTLGVSDDFIAGWLADNYGDLLSEVLASIDARDYSFKIEVCDCPPAPAAPAPAMETPSLFDFPTEPPPVPVSAPAAAKLPCSRMFAPAPELSSPEVKPARPASGVAHFTFDNFVVGDENRYAFDAARGVARNAGDCNYNPLYIYGPTGIGKTHLIHAVRNEMLAVNPKANVRYVTCDEIVNSFVESLREHRFSEFRASLRNVDALLVDDIHALARKSETQEQFFNAFNELYRMNKQIILTSDKQPCEIQGLEARLISRFEAGLTCDILPPGYEIRLAILRQCAREHLCTDISDGVLNFIASNISSSVRRLKGAFLRVVGVASSSHRRITEEFAEGVLRQMIEHENTTRSLSCEAIQQAVADHFGVRLSDIHSSRRPRNIAEARMAAMYLCRKLTGRSYPEIGAAFGKNHATVLNAMTRIEELCKSSDQMRHSISLLERQLKTSH